MLEVHVDSMLRVEGDVNGRLRERVAARLTIPNPEYAMRERRGLWLGGTPKTLCAVSGSRTYWWAPRGARRVVEEEAEALGWFTVWRLRHAAVEAVPPLVFSGQLRPYQAEAARWVAAEHNGYLVMPCGSGKTVTALAAVADAGMATLIVVHMLDLLQQWIVAIKDHLGVDAGEVSGRRKRPAYLVDVATVQTLNGRSGLGVSVDPGRYGMVVVDECHHVPARTFAAVVDRLPAVYRIGLSATPDRSDGLGALLGWHLGPELCRVDHSALVAEGHLVQPRVERVLTGCQPTGGEEGNDFGALLAEIVADEGRTEQIAGLACQDAQAGHRVLVLSARVQHCGALAAAVRSRGVAAEALTGKVSAGRRKAILAGLRSGEVPVVCATSLADEGLDVVDLSRVILATPQRAAGRTIQRLGRLMRPAPGKPQPVLYDLVDEHGVCWGQWRARERAYRQVLGWG